MAPPPPPPVTPLPTIFANNNINHSNNNNSQAVFPPATTGSPSRVGAASTGSGAFTPRTPVVADATRHTSTRPNIANSGTNYISSPAAQPPQSASRRRLHHTGTGRPVSATIAGEEQQSSSVRRSVGTQQPPPLEQPFRSANGSISSESSSGSSSSSSASTGADASGHNDTSSALNHLQSVTQAFFNLRQFLAAQPFQQSTTASSGGASYNNNSRPSVARPNAAVNSTQQPPNQMNTTTTTTASRGTSTSAMNHSSNQRMSTAVMVPTARANSSTATEIMQSLRVSDSRVNPHSRHNHHAHSHHTHTHNHNHTHSRAVNVFDPQFREGDNDDDDEEEDEDVDMADDFDDEDEDEDMMDDDPDFIDMLGGRGRSRNNAPAARLLPPANNNQAASRLRQNNGARELLRWYRTSQQQTATATDALAGAQMGYNHHTQAQMYNHFRFKTVCRLACRSCQRALCERGMKAILLADTKVELYSTDAPPLGSVQLVNEDYRTDNCHCRIQDMACLGCGNVVGYHVTQPCESCLDSCNNGHFWMFQVEGVTCQDRQDESGTKPLLWAFLASPDVDRAVMQSQTEVLAR